MKLECPGYKSAIITTPTSAIRCCPLTCGTKLGENDPGMITVQFTVTLTDADFSSILKKVDPTIPLKLSPNHKIKIVKEGHPTFKQKSLLMNPHYQFVLDWNRDI
ncbi:MAG: hypothetical protein IPN18_10005 [Ignavibacteriales bacterium]|nr:hypothetical protein [Ignavibacteriales bacterium]